MSTSREEDVEPVASALPNNERTREQSASSQPGDGDEYRLDLTDAERTGLVRELRRYGEMREDLAFGMADPGPELSFELSNDPTYFYGPQWVLDEVIEKAERQAIRDRDAGLEQAAIWFDMADTVERTGQLDLADAGTCGVVQDVLDQAGWYSHDPDGLPDDLTRIARTVWAADETLHNPLIVPSENGPQQVAYHTGRQASQLSETTQRLKYRMPPPVQQQMRGRAI